MSGDALAVIEAAEARAIARFLRLAGSRFPEDEKSLLGELIKERLVDRLKNDPKHKRIYEWGRRKSASYVQIFSEEIQKDIGLLGLSSEDCLFLLALLHVAPPLHKFYLAWSDFIGNREFKKDSKRKDSLLKEVPHFANPYTLFFKEGGCYRVLPFSDHPAVYREIQELLGAIAGAAGSLPRKSLHRKFMDAWYSAMAERDLDKISRRWYALYSGWFRLDGKITLGLPLEERYEDPFAIRHHPELLIEIADQEFRALEKDIVRYTSFLRKEFVRISRPYGATALRRASSLSRAKVVIRAAVLGAGGRFFSGSLYASTQPNNFRFRVNRGFRIAYFPRTKLNYLQKHEIPVFRNLIGLLRDNAFLPEEGALENLLWPRVLLITAHEASHLLFRRGTPDIEEIKAEVLGWYGLSRLFATGKLSSVEWNAICHALFADLAYYLGFIARSAEFKGIQPSECEVGNPYVRAWVLFANHLLHFGVVDLRHGTIDHIKLDGLLEALSKRFVRIYTAKNFNAARDKFLRDKGVTFLDPQWDEIALKLRKLQSG